MRLYARRAAIGTVVGGVPAVLLPFLLRRHPVMVAILDPFMVGGYGAPKLAFAPLFILWFGIGIESKIALVASVVFFIVYFNTLAGVRALDPKLVQMAQIAGASERQSRAISFSGGGALIRRLPARVLRHRRSGHRRATPTRAGPPGTDRRHNFDTTGFFVPAATPRPAANCAQHAEPRSCAGGPSSR
jgi:hypothetical protein